MEDFELDLVIGEGPAARTVRIELQPFYTYWGDNATWAFDHAT
jgi:Holliday junction resolvasome RuvABC ATP-dependent DNA helicase subunit